MQHLPNNHTHNTQQLATLAQLDRDFEQQDVQYTLAELNELLGA